MIETFKEWKTTVYPYYPNIPSIIRYIVGVTIITIVYPTALIYHAIKGVSI